TFVHGLDAGDLVGAADLQVVLQVFADAVKRVPHLDAERLQHRAGADARELQDLRRADSAGRQDDLAGCHESARLAVLAQAQASYPLAVEDQLFDLRVRLDHEVAAMAHGAQKALRGVPADAGLLVDVEVAATLVIAAVEVVHLRNARLLGRVAKGIEDLPADARGLDAPLATARV